MIYSLNILPQQIGVEYSIRSMMVSPTLQLSHIVLNFTVEICRRPLVLNNLIINFSELVTNFSEFMILIHTCFQATGEPPNI